MNYFNAMKRILGPVFLFTFMYANAAHSHFMFPDVKRIQEEMIKDGQPIHRSDGVLDKETMIYIGKTCELKHLFCAENVKYTYMYFFDLLDMLRFAIVTNPKAFSDDVMNKTMKRLETLNGIGSDEQAILSLFMRGAPLLRVNFPESGGEEGYFYNPFLDVLLVLRLNKNTAPESGFFMSGERARGETHENPLAPQWTLADEPISSLTSVAEETAKASERQEAIAASVFSTNSPTMDENDKRIVLGRLGAMVTGLRASNNNCARSLDKKAMRDGGMSFLEKRYNSKDPAAGNFTDGVLYLQGAHIDLAGGGFWRVYTNALNPSDVEIIEVSPKTLKRCIPNKFYFPHIYEIYKDGWHSLN